MTREVRENVAFFSCFFLFISVFASFMFYFKAGQPSITPNFTPNKIFTP